MRCDWDDSSISDSATSTSNAISFDTPSNSQKAENIGQRCASRDHLPVR